MVAFFSKPIESDGFEQMFWSTAIAKTINGEVQLHAQVDGKEIVITESSVRRDLQLADEEAINYFPNSTIFKQLTLMRVLDLENTKTTQRNEIDSLKRKFKKLKNRNRSRTHKLKRLYKVGLSARVEFFDNEESLGKDASKQEKRIDVIDSDEDITLVSVQDDTDNKMFDLDDLVSTAATTVTITTEEITLAQALKALKTSKLKVKRIGFQEPCKSTTTTIIISSQQSQDKGKGIMIEEPVKPKKKDQIRLDKEAALMLQAKFDEEERLARERERERAKKEQEANIALIETWDDIQAKINADHQLAERLQVQEQEELSDAKKATLFQQLLEKRRKHFAAKRA
uniref:Xylulose kinase-1 n=1 Tax=Tanacetum cinerariifolium TaxID=118510 RepID=A0A6L2J0Z5_TANCI|nr:hypothetical protein [Tanacetum cinerariifolium]